MRQPSLVQGQTSDSARPVTACLDIAPCSSTTVRNSPVPTTVIVPSVVASSTPTVQPIEPRLADVLEPAVARSMASRCLELACGMSPEIRSAAGHVLEATARAGRISRLQASVRRTGC